MSKQQPQSYARPDAILREMSFDEKIGQLCMLDGRKLYLGDIPNHQSVQHMAAVHTGSIINVQGEIASVLQSHLTARHRLSIPPLFAMDCINGHSFWNEGTTFPTRIALSSSWDLELFELIGEATALQMIATNIHWALAPVMDTARDPRFGRIGETAGEDGYLAGLMGAASIRGFQGCGADRSTSVLACAKHFAGYSEGLGGRDSTEYAASSQTLQAETLSPWRHALKARPASVMAGYHAVDGIPCTANGALLQDLLRDQMGFNGLVLTDWQNVDRLVDLHRVAPDLESAAAIAVANGTDIVMGTPNFPAALKSAFEHGKVGQDHIDTACLRVLEMKEKLGLLETEEPNRLSRGRNIADTEAAKSLALEAALQSAILLKNDKLLPLSASKNGKIALIGPAIDSVVEQLGDWSLGLVGRDGWLSRNVEEGPQRCVTLLQGMKDYCQARGIDVVSHYGCELTDNDRSDVSVATEIGGQADVIIAVVGDCREMAGEQHDRASLHLAGRQDELIEELKNTGRPLIVVYMANRPLIIDAVAELADAFLCIWNPGERGGDALPQLLFGDISPSGRLTVTFPRHGGATPVRYDQRPGWHFDDQYCDLPEALAVPVFAFGEGLTYGRFEYHSLQMSHKELVDGDAATVTFCLRNIGDRPATETAQVYICDEVGSRTRAARKLCAWQRVFLAPGENRTVSLNIAPEEMAIWHPNGHGIVEAGTFTIYVGPSSRPRDLTLSAKFEVLSEFRLNDSPAQNHKPDQI